MRQQLDGGAAVYGTEGWGFESLLAHWMAGEQADIAFGLSPPAVSMVGIAQR